MRNVIHYVSLALSTLAFLGTLILLLEKGSENKQKFTTLSAYHVTNISKGELLSVSGYLVKKNGRYTLYETEESSKFNTPNGFIHLTILHPEDNINNSCDESWVNVIGVAEHSLWGNSIDFLHQVTSLENGKNCMVNQNKRIKYLKVLNESTKP